ncbi:MAG: hypothetical protein QOE19_2765 [Actinomycetota bacterium]|jgi:hypothetical protein|nr:hypothetical protein [Actinomycetota bacterium]MDQ1664219.1 hypothetical protein [Actinomycetota bacterium]
MSRYSGTQGKGAARRVRELKQDEAEARNPATAKRVEAEVEATPEDSDR